ncbi:hypothetical protein MUK42_33837 [Musa troglodytarum]|uniref:SWIB domain-containing protein n=1 Tax=Musa troglodytarum TaxID=320322 RepID=A0A9E7GGA1_9LILI|nr:hypothetical protein MUK42_33837 [Musa troglodytarum]URE14864.1 hypothetical protein MUK42_33837 [Musa troglodytarum]
MAASISFPTAFFSSARAGPVPLPRRAVHLPGCLPPRRWLAAAASRVAAEAAPDASGKRRPRGITKSRPVSPELQAVDPDNKRVIVCDEKLKKIFGGRDRVGFLEISGLLNPHFGKLQEWQSDAIYSPAVETFLYQVPEEYALLQNNEVVPGVSS